MFLLSSLLPLFLAFLAHGLTQFEFYYSLNYPYSMNRLDLRSLKDIGKVNIPIADLDVHEPFLTFTIVQPTSKPTWKTWLRRLTRVGIYFSARRGGMDGVHRRSENFWNRYSRRIIRSSSTWRNIFERWKLPPSLNAKGRPQEEIWRLTLTEAAKASFLADFMQSSDESESQLNVVHFRIPFELIVDTMSGAPLFSGDYREVHLNVAIQEGSYFFQPRMSWQRTQSRPLPFISYGERNRKNGMLTLENERVLRYVQSDPAKATNDIRYMDVTSFDSSQLPVLAYSLAIERARTSERGGLSDQDLLMALMDKTPVKSLPKLMGLPIWTALSKGDNDSILKLTDSSRTKKAFRAIVEKMLNFGKAKDYRNMATVISLYDVGKIWARKYRSWELTQYEEQVNKIFLTIVEDEQKTNYQTIKLLMDSGLSAAVCVSRIIEGVSKTGRKNPSLLDVFRSYCRMEIEAYLFDAGAQALTDNDPRVNDPRFVLSLARVSLKDITVPQFLNFDGLPEEAGRLLDIAVKKNNIDMVRKAVQISDINSDFVVGAFYHLDSLLKTLSENDVKKLYEPLVKRLSTRDDRANVNLIFSDPDFYALFSMSLHGGFKFMDLLLHEGHFKFLDVFYLLGVHGLPGLERSMAMHPPTLEMIFQDVNDYFVDQFRQLTLVSVGFRDYVRRNKIAFTQWAVRTQCLDMFLIIQRLQGEISLANYPEWAVQATENAFPALLSYSLVKMRPIMETRAVERSLGTILHILTGSHQKNMVSAKWCSTAVALLQFLSRPDSKYAYSKSIVIQSVWNVNFFQTCLRDEVDLDGLRALLRYGEYVTSKLINHIHEDARVRDRFVDLLTEPHSDRHIHVIEDEEFPLQDTHAQRLTPFRRAMSQ